MNSAPRRDLFLKILEETRKKYQFIVAGYVVMPEHFHLLIGEPKIKNPSVVMQVLKQRVSLRCRKKKRQPETATYSAGQRFAAGVLATSLLRFQRWHQAEVHSEAQVHSLQPCKTRAGEFTRTVALEQLPILLVR